MPLIVNQVEIHLAVDCLDDGTLDQCLERDITPVSSESAGRRPAGRRWPAEPTTAPDA